MLGGRRPWKPGWASQANGGTRRWPATGGQKDQNVPYLGSGGGLRRTAVVFAMDSGKGDAEKRVARGPPSALSEPKHAPARCPWGLDHFLQPESSSYITGEMTDRGPVKYAHRARKPTDFLRTHENRRDMKEKDHGAS